jgi:hypothetical protein
VPGGGGSADSDRGDGVVDAHRLESGARGSRYACGRRWGGRRCRRGRIAALVSIVGLALLLFGLIETDVRQPATTRTAARAARAARPAGRNILAAFQGLGATYTPNGLRLDRLTTTQRHILNLLNIDPPWPEHDQH